MKPPRQSPRGMAVAAMAMAVVVATAAGCYSGFGRTGEDDAAGEDLHAADTAVADPGIDDAVSHDPVADDTAVHDPVIDDTWMDDPWIDDPVADDPAVDDPPADPADDDGPAACPGPGAWVTIPAGTFTMGSPETEIGRLPEEVQHVVTLTHAFEMQATEVTQAQFLAVLLYNHSEFAGCGSLCPVEMVSWHEAAAYCNFLSVDAGLDTCYECTGYMEDTRCSRSVDHATIYDCPGYRLPTEAEWEYAARAGTTGGTYAGTCALTPCDADNPVLGPIAWFCANSEVAYEGCWTDIMGDPPCMGTHPVCTKAPNAWGLYDMLGSVWEWCNDFGGDYPGDATDPIGGDWSLDRVMRGGSWIDSPRSARAARREDSPPAIAYHSLGFRVVRTLP